MRRDLEDIDSRSWRGAAVRIGSNKGGVRGETVEQGEAYRVESASNAGERGERGEMRWAKDLVRRKTRGQRWNMRGRPQRDGGC